MNHLSSTQLAELRETLLQRRQEVTDRITNTDHFGMGESLRDNTGELSPVDNHPGDLGTEMFEKGKDLALMERDRLELDDISAALEAMEAGTYGLDVITGEPIPFERLQAVPYTRFTKENSPRQARPKTRPVDEEFLDPPFGRTSLDDRGDQNGFDGEDSWQAVAVYGNSNTPALAEGREIGDYNQMEIEDYEEQVGFVEPYENFIATDITGREVTVVRGPHYKQYMDSGEGSYLLDPLYDAEDEV